MNSEKLSDFVATISPIINLFFNPGQKKGDQTDYGLYVMLALEYFANHHIPKEDSAVNFEAFLPLWAGKFTSNLWGAWVCTQTKQALGKYIQQGKRSDEKFVKSLGGMSNAMGIRSPAALGVYEDIESLVQVLQSKFIFTESKHPIEKFIAKAPKQNKELTFIKLQKLGFI